jgi:hypothetical protein
LWSAEQTSFDCHYRYATSFVKSNSWNIYPMGK